MQGSSTSMVVGAGDGATSFQQVAHSREEVHYQVVEDLVVRVIWKVRWWSISHVDSIVLPSNGKAGDRNSREDAHLS